MAFKIETFFNPHLGMGVSRLDAIVSVKNEGGAMVARAASKEVAFIIDVSGSMNENHKLEIAKKALIRCLEQLDENTRFSIISFQSAPRVEIAMRAATPDAKRAAIGVINGLHANGGTCMSKALLRAAGEFSREAGATGYAMFLTDGQNDKDDQRDLVRAIEQCKGVFQCDCRGVGTDWQPDQLRLIADALLGVADAAPDPAVLEAQFREALTAALSKGVGQASLRLWSPKTVKVVGIKQMTPAILDLTGQARRLDEKTLDIMTGAWGDEDREYHIAFEISAGDEGEEVLACRPSMVWMENGQERKDQAPTPIVATWTADEGLSTRINPEVAHFTGQTELADAIKQGLEQKSQGNEEEATRLLGRAAQIAAESGNDEATKRLSKVVDIVDAEAGTVRMRRDAGKGAELELDMGGTRTVRRRVGVTPPQQTN
jgi:hypothetical protein